MDFTDAPRKPKTESIVPMINVVFLLLIFFLMTAQIAPPEPFEVTPPTAEQDFAQPPAEQNLTLYIDRNGKVQLNDAQGEAAFEEIAQIAATISTLQLRVDAMLEGAKLARIMSRLSQAKVQGIQVVVTPQ